MGKHRNADSASLRTFLSYSHRDKAIVRRIESALEAGGFDVWRDERSTRPGELIATAYAEAIEAVDLFLPLLTPASVESRFFQHELDLAIHRRNTGGDLVIAPILGESCDIPSVLKSIQRFDLTVDPDDGVKRLPEWLKSVENHNSPPKLDLCMLSDADVESIASTVPNPALLEVLAVQIDLAGVDFAHGSALDRVQAFFQAAYRESKIGQALRMLQQFESRKPKQLAAFRAKRAEQLARPSVILSDFGNCWERIEHVRRHVAEVLGSPPPRARPSRPSSAYEVAVVGAFSAGKSTLINALIGRAILPETNQVCTPCPTFVHKLSTGRERVIATNFESAEVSSMMTRMLAKAGVQDRDLERALGEGRWSEFLLTCPSQPSGPGDTRGRRNSLEDFVLPTARALEKHAAVLGTGQELDLSALSQLRAPGPSEATAQLLLKRIDVYVDAPALTDGVCLVDTPGVTSQNPAHKEFAFGVVQRCHALVVVEPFNAPLGEGPDAVMDAFYARLARDAAGSGGRSSKVFVVLNKCDLGEYDRTGVSATVQSTIDAVRRKYSTAWGVPRDRYFGLSGLLFLEELEAHIEGPTRVAVDPLLLEFRRFKSRLNRYLVDAVEKTAALDSLSALDNDLDARIVEQQARIASLEENGSSRGSVIADLDQRRRAYDQGFAEAQRSLSLLPRQAADATAHSLASGVHYLQAEVVTKLNEYWAVSQRLGDEVFERWFTSVYSDELPLLTGAALHTWGTAVFPTWVREQVHAVVSSTVHDLERQHLDRVSIPLAPLRLPIAEAFLSKLPTTDSLRASWDVICVSDRPRRHRTARDRLEHRVGLYFREVLEGVRDAIPAMAASVVEAYASRGLSRLSTHMRALDAAMAEALRDADRSQRELAQQLEATRQGLELATGMKQQLDALRTDVEHF